MLDNTTPVEHKPRAKSRRGRLDQSLGVSQVVLTWPSGRQESYPLQPLDGAAIEHLALRGLRSVLQTAKDPDAVYARFAEGRFAPEHTRPRPRISLWKLAAADVLVEERGLPFDEALEQVRQLGRNEITQLRQIAAVAEAHARRAGQAPASVSRLLGLAT